MKRSSFFLKTAGKAAGLLAVLLACSIVLIGCEDNGGDGGGGGRTITITDITQSGAVAVNIASQFSSSTDYIVSAGTGTVSNNSVTIELRKVAGGAVTQEEWTGTGAYFIYLMVNSQSPNYFYTNGKSWTDLGVTSSTTTSSLNSKLPKYDVQEGNITIPFDKFLTTTTL